MWRYRSILLAFITACLAITVKAQTESKKKLADKLSQPSPADTLRATDTDSIKVSLHSPRKATIYSAILPGLGQAYNKKYWKMPVIYGIAGVLTYFVVDNNKEYAHYKKAYKWRLDNDPSTIDQYVNTYTDEDLRILKNYYRRNRDLSYIGLGLTYMLNIVDAAVDAHLFYFDVSDDLSLRIEPQVSPFTPQNYAGLKLSIQLR
jgi:hypothetical protein